MSIGISVVEDSAKYTYQAHSNSSVLQKSSVDLQRKWDRERMEETNLKVMPIKCQVFISLGDKIICFVFVTQTAGAGVL